MTSGERELRKKLDIVYRVFKQGSSRLTRIDRNWQEVIDSQVYIIEELRNETDQPEPTKSRKEKAQSPLEQAISDFQFTLNKAIETMVESGLMPVRQAPAEESVVPSRDVDNLRQAMRKLNEIAERDRSQLSAGGNPSMKISSVSQFKSYSIRMIKALKEDLAKI